MAVGNFTVYDEFIENTGIAGLSGASVYAVLLTSSYTPDNAAHDTYSDISGSEASGGDYDQVQCTSVSVVDIAGGARFTTANVSWGSSVTIPAVKYLALVVGSASSPGANDVVIGYMDLNDTSGSSTVSATNGQFAVNTPATGWFTSTRS